MVAARLFRSCHMESFIRIISRGPVEHLIHKEG
jgi:hypothetical protein